MNELKIDEGYLDVIEPALENLASQIIKKQSQLLSFF